MKLLILVSALLACFHSFGQLIPTYESSSMKYGLLKLDSCNSQLDSIEILPPIFETYEEMDFGYIFHNVGDDAFVNMDGKVKIRDSIDILYPYSQCDKLLISKNDMFGVLNVNGNYEIPIDYSSIYQVFISCYSILKKEKKYGLADGNGKIIIPIKYDSIYYATNHDNEIRVVLERNGMFEVVDTAGNNILPQGEYSQFSCEKGQIRYVSDSTHYLFNFEGELEGVSFHQPIEWYSYNLARYYDHSIKKFGYVNRFGKLVIPKLYESADHFNCGLAIARLNGTYGVLDTMGNHFLPFEYEDINITIRPQMSYDPYSMKIFSWFKTKKDNYFGCIIGSDAKTIIPAKYDNIVEFPSYPFLLKTKKNDKIGLINIESNSIVEPLFDTIYEYHLRNYYEIGWSKKWLRVKANNKFGIIDFDGKEVLRNEYDFIAPSIFKNLLAVKKGNFWYYLNKNIGIEKKAKKPLKGHHISTPNN